MMNMKNYLCPVANKKRVYDLSFGYIVNSTPNDEQLHINSDKIFRKEELSEGEEPKERE